MLLQAVSHAVSSCCKVSEGRRIPRRGKEKSQAGQSQYLAWKLEKGKYISRASILLNGATITCISKEDGKEVYRFDNPVDFAKCYVTIAGVPFCEGLFDYLENNGILSLDKDVRYVEYIDGKDRGRTISGIESDRNSPNTLIGRKGEEIIRY